MSLSPKKTLAVWKFASCDGCQLSLLDLEDEILMLTEHLEIAYFPEASSHFQEGPYDLSLVEGSITTAEDAERILAIRRSSRTLVTIGACATAGGIQALRNFKDVKEFLAIVYAHPEYISTLDRSLPISHFVAVDYELRGCPIQKYQLLELISSYLLGKRPAIADESVCMACKRQGNICLTVVRQALCLGPVTHTGCNALCPSYDRACFGCYGPKEQSNTSPLAHKFKEWGSSSDELQRLFRNFNAGAEAFAKESRKHDPGT